MGAKRPLCDVRKSEGGRTMWQWTAIGMPLLYTLVHGLRLFHCRSVWFFATRQDFIPIPHPRRQTVATNTGTLPEISEISSDVAYNTAPSAIVRVFVYDVPQLDRTELIECYRRQNDGFSPWQDEHEERAQNTAEIWLHRALLVHPWRVLDPEEADLFYVPVYPMVSQVHDWGRDFKDYRRHFDPTITHHTCEGLTHSERMDAAVDYLRHESIYFNRFGGADHLLVCSWWASRIALSPQHRMILRRVVQGTPERLVLWNRPGCGVRKLVAIPYTPSKFLTSSSTLGGLSSEKRDITFFFVGSSRGRPERENLDEVKRVSTNSFIVLGSNSSEWEVTPMSNAAYMARSRFCFCPRGDTETSRRLFDALAAGCVPVLTESASKAYPSPGMEFSEFSVVVDNETFGSRRRLSALAHALLARSDEEVRRMQRGVRAAASNLVYGVADGQALTDMKPFLGPATHLLQTSRTVMGGAGHRGSSFWECPEVPRGPDAANPRSRAKLPPSENGRWEWLSFSETIVSQEHSLLFCAPPNTGSLQFRMLAKRMKGVQDWSVSSDRTMLFDPAASELSLLNVTDGPLLERIYRDNGSGWIKIGVVRDPVTRVLAAYLDHVRFLSLSGADHLPPFSEVVDNLPTSEFNTSPAFRPLFNLCGVRYSPFDVVIPFERLKVTAVKVLQSLPGGLWEAYGASGWGPAGNHSFMDLDLGGIVGASEGYRVQPDLRVDLRDHEVNSKDDMASAPAVRMNEAIPRHTSMLFNGESCAWTKYYADLETLERVGKFYAKDFRMYRWYSLDRWRERLKACLQNV